MSRTGLIAALGLVAAAALPVAPAAGDKPPHPAHPPSNAAPKAPKGSHAVAYKAKGNVKTVDVGANKLIVTVGSGAGDTNSHSRAWAGHDVTFVLTGARIRVNHDSNNDGKRDLSDAKTGDAAKVLAKLPKSSAGTGPFAAKRVTIKASAPPQP